MGEEFVPTAGVIDTGPFKCALNTFEGSIRTRGMPEPLSHLTIVVGDTPSVLGRWSAAKGLKVTEDTPDYLVEPKGKQ